MFVMDAPPNRITQFCENAPAPTVVRAKIRDRAPPEIERLYGSPAPTDKISQRFARTTNGDDETLLLSLANDGKVLGTAWPVFRDQVSLELGIPDMKEQEAAALLLSSKCRDELRAFRDHGARPVAAEPRATGGCSRCETGAAAGGPTPDAALLFVVVALVIVRLRAWPSRSRGPA